MHRWYRADSYRNRVPCWALLAGLRRRRRGEGLHAVPHIQSESQGCCSEQPSPSRTTMDELPPPPPPGTGRTRVSGERPIAADSNLLRRHALARTGNHTTLAAPLPTLPSTTVGRQGPQNRPPPPPASAGRGFAFNHPQTTKFGNCPPPQMMRASKHRARGFRFHIARGISRHFAPGIARGVCSVCHRPGGMRQLWSLPPTKLHTLPHVAPENCPRKVVCFGRHALDT